MRKPKRTQSATKPEEAGALPRDIAIMHGPTADGQGTQLLRLRDGELSAGEIRPVREGQAVNGGELVRLRPLRGNERVCEVEVLHDSADTVEKARGEDSGKARLDRPARVATDTYRKNWSAIFDGSRADRKRKRGDWSVN